LDRHGVEKLFTAKRTIIGVWRALLVDWRFQGRKVGLS